VPRNNVLLVGAVVLVGSFVISFGLGAEMLNFGALIGFMGVNWAAFLHFYVRAPQRSLWNAVAPLAGFVICFALWISLGAPAKIVGLIWMLVGLALGAWRTNWFRRKFSFDAG